MVKLAVGCGQQIPQPDLVRLDISSKVNSDIVGNLEQNREKLSFAHLWKKQQSQHFC